MSGVLAAAYFVLTVVDFPLAFGPIQFRLSELLKPAALYHPAFAFAFGIGNFFANLSSPFGPWDYIGMSLVDTGAALTAYALRRRPWIAITVQAVLTSLGVAILPLGIAGGFPIVPTFASVLVSELILYYLGYAVIWRKYGYLLVGKRPDTSGVSAPPRDF